MHVGIDDKIADNKVFSFGILFVDKFDVDFLERWDERIVGENVPHLQLEFVRVVALVALTPARHKE